MVSIEAMVQYVYFARLRTIYVYYSRKTFDCKREFLSFEHPNLRIFLMHNLRIIETNSVYKFIIGMFSIICKGNSAYPSISQSIQLIMSLYNY